MGAVDEPGNILQQRDVGGDLALDARAQHLDHDFAPWRVALGAQRRGVNLRNGCGSARHGVEVRVGVVDGASQRLLDAARSEEHTSELQSLMRISYAVFCLKNKTDI